MYYKNKLLIGKNENIEASILSNMANRHGLITGASGSGKTVTLKVMAESFSKAGTPVFMVDVKGDLKGTSKIGQMDENITKRVEKLNLKEFTVEPFPVNYFDVYGKNGHPIRTTVENIGAKLLARMLNLSDVQEGVLVIAFQIAKDENKKLNDLQDLKDLLKYINENKDEYILNYGNITSQSIAAINRSVLELISDGGNYFFGKPTLDLYDLFSFNEEGKGYINILNAEELFKKPVLYATFLVWLLNTLYDNMPEVGDLDKPKFILFLDEAHLIFSEMNNELTKKIIGIIKLIRSKGIGVYFISQSPSDIPDEILSQLGNKVQHVLRCYTPSDEKSLKAAATSFRENPDFKTIDAIKTLGTGEAIVSFLDENGEPSICECVKILPPQSLMGSLSDEELSKEIKKSRLFGKYETLVNEESASEKIEKLNEEKRKKEDEEKNLKEKEKEEKIKQKEEEKEAKRKEKEKEQASKKTKKFIEKTGDKIINKLLTKLINSIFK